MFTFVYFFYCIYLNLHFFFDLWHFQLRGGGALRADSVPHVVFLRGLQGPRHQRQAQYCGVTPQRGQQHSPEHALTDSWSNSCVHFDTRKEMMQHLWWKLCTLSNAQILVPVWRKKTVLNTDDESIQRKPKWSLRRRRRIENEEEEQRIENKENKKKKNREE